MLMYGTEVKLSEWWIIEIQVLEEKFYVQVYSLCWRKLVRMLYLNYVGNCLYCTEGSVELRGFCDWFVTWLRLYGEKLAPHPTPKL